MTSQIVVSIIALILYCGDESHILVLMAVIPAVRIPRCGKWVRWFKAVPVAFDGFWSLMPLWNILFVYIPMELVPLSRSLNEACRVSSSLWMRLRYERQMLFTQVSSYVEFFRVGCTIVRKQKKKK